MRNGVAGSVVLSTMMNEKIAKHRRYGRFNVADSGNLHPAYEPELQPLSELRLQEASQDIIGYLLVGLILLGFPTYWLLKGGMIADGLLNHILIPVVMIFSLLGGLVLARENWKKLSGGSQRDRLIVDESGLRYIKETEGVKHFEWAHIVDMAIKIYPTRHGSEQFVLLMDSNDKLHELNISQLKPVGQSILSSEAWSREVDPKKGKLALLRRCIANYWKPKTHRLK